MLEELAADSLRLFLRITAVVAWAWILTVRFATRAPAFNAYLVLVLAIATVAASGYLLWRHLEFAVGVCLVGLLAMVTLIALTFPGLLALFLFSMLLPITAALTNPRVTWGMAGACTLIVTLLGVADRRVALAASVQAIASLLLTALTLWLSSRRLLTALDWALSMTEEAQWNALDAQERRAEVRRILKSLEEAYVRLERANQALIFAREAAEKAYRFKAEFVANVSHELRTPLNLIVGFSEMMATAPESYKGRKLPSQYRGDVMAIYRSARHLSDLIDDVLDLSQIEAGRLPLTREATDLGEIIREAVDIVRGLAEAKGLKLELALPRNLPPLPLDRTRIRQVLLNLLSNATRFTDQGWIRVCARMEGQEVRVSVEDSGRGIAPDKIAQAFEAFSQLDDDRARQGTGLGLAVSRKFVELHGGRMWIESTLGWGTTIGLALPIGEGGKATVPALLKSGAPAPGGDGRPPVLVLHDDPHVLTLLRRYVEGYRFVLADSVARAVELVRQAPPPVVIMDSVWAERWLEAAEKAELTEPLPILTCPLPSLRQVGLLLRAVDYLAKPIRREDLLAALARLPRPPHTVLVVDDDPNFARLLVRLLKAQDEAIGVLMASSGAEALSIARSQRPDLVLLDLLMPGVSGYDVLEEMRSDPALEDLAVIILSARSLEQEAKPLEGELRLARRGGLTLTETVQAIQGLLAAITQPAAAAPTSAAAFSAVPPA